MSRPCKSLCGRQTNVCRYPVLGHWKSRHRFLYLKAVARELLGMQTAISVPSERVFSHAGNMYSKKRANFGIRIFAIHMLMTTNQARNQGGPFGAFAPPKFSKHCIAILTFVETFKKR